MKEMFDQVLHYRGQPVKLWHRPVTVNCPCVHDVYKTADKYCQLCGGTGSTTGWTEEPDLTFVAIVFIAAEIRQDQHTKLRTRTGPIETFDGRMYIESRWWSKIHLFDHIVFMQRDQTEGIEMQIISKLPRYGTDNEIIFIRCDLERQPTKLRQAATNVEGLI
jgi:hypothetical protein